MGTVYKNGSASGNSGNGEEHQNDGRPIITGDGGVTSEAGAEKYVEYETKRLMRRYQISRDVAAEQAKQRLETVRRIELALQARLKEIASEW